MHSTTLLNSKYRKLNKNREQQCLEQIGDRSTITQTENYKRKKMQTCQREKNL